MKNYQDKIESNNGWLSVLIIFLLFLGLFYWMLVG
jgi:preprotein translocase subunit YajC